jgi:hypothetical protein
MLILEFFRSKHRYEQINKKQQCDHADDGRFHVELLQLLAKAHVESAQDKKGDDNPDKDKVTHIVTFTISEMLARVLIKLRAKCVKKSLTFL